MGGMNFALVFRRGTEVYMMPKLTYLHIIERRFWLTSGLPTVRSETNGGQPPGTYLTRTRSRSRYCRSRLISMNR